MGLLTVMLCDARLFMIGVLLAAGFSLKFLLIAAFL